MSVQNRGEQGMMGGNHRIWYPPLSRQERFIHVCRQREQWKALEEEAVLEDSRESN